MKLSITAYCHEHGCELRLEAPKVKAVARAIPKSKVSPSHVVVVIPMTCPKSAAGDYCREKWVATPVEMRMEVFT